MNVQSNATAKIISGTSKSGKAYECLEVTISTRGGDYIIRNFPSPLELAMIKDAINPMNAIYGDNN